LLGGEGYEYLGAPLYHRGRSNILLGWRTIPA